MSLSLLITINVLADIALLGGLAYAMSRAKGLTPHVASVQPAQSSAAEQRLVLRSSSADQPLAPQPEERSAHVARPDFARPRASMAQRPGAQTAAAHDSAA